MFKSRLITSFVLIPIVIGVLFLMPPFGFTTVLLLVCMLAAWEWGQFAGFTSHFQRCSLAMLCGLMLILMLFSYQSYGVLYVITISLWASLGWWSVALLLVLFYPSSAIFWRQSRVLQLLFGVLTIVPFFWSMLALRQYHYEFNSFIGAWWLLYVMFLVWSADSGAYLFGRMFGKNKLAPRVSPGKTWEGFFGGLVMSALISCLFSHYVPLDLELDSLLVCSIITVLASVVGDLTESMFKREAGIKDSGNLIPGHGGILDRIDSLMAAMPLFACLLLIIFKKL